MSKATKTTPLDRLRATLYDGGRQPRGDMPTSVTGGMGAVPGAGIDTAREPVQPRQMSERQAATVMQAELVNAVRSLVDASTEITARLGRRGAMNGVIDVSGFVFPAGAPSVVTKSYETTAGAIVVTNHSAATTITVQSGIAAGDTGPQSAGVGVQYVGPGQRAIMPLGDRSWTMSGFPGDRVSVQAFTGLQPFGVTVL